MSGDGAWGSHTPEEGTDRDDVSAAPESGQPVGGRDASSDADDTDAQEKHTPKGEDL